MRIRVDLPAPLGPSRPYIPAGIVRVTSFSACTPLGYVLETPRICSSMQAFYCRLKTAFMHDLSSYFTIQSYVRIVANVGRG